MAHQPDTTLRAEEVAARRALAMLQHDRVMADAAHIARVAEQARLRAVAKRKVFVVPSRVVVPSRKRIIWTQEEQQAS